MALQAEPEISESCTLLKCNWKSYKKPKKVEQVVDSTEKPGKNIEKIVPIRSQFIDQQACTVKYRSMRPRYYLKVAQSPVHGLGLLSTRSIPQDTFLIEYLGERISRAESDRREKAYNKVPILKNGCYLFGVDEDWVIDATRIGNIARFMNHSCEPNCITRKIKIKGQLRIIYISKRIIEEGEELTFDYCFPYEKKKIACHCGAPNCRKVMN